MGPGFVNGWTVCACFGQLKGGRVSRSQGVQEYTYGRQRPGAFRCGYIRTKRYARHFSPPKWSLATSGEPFVVIEPTHKVLILTLDTVPPIRADDKSGMRERGTATKDNSGPTLQITQKGNRAEGPYTHNTTTVTHHLHVSAPATRARSALPLHASSLALCDATSPPPAHGVVGAVTSGKVP